MSLRKTTSSLLEKTSSTLYVFLAFAMRGIVTSVFKKVTMVKSISAVLPGVTPAESLQISRKIPLSTFLVVYALGQIIVGYALKRYKREYIEALLYTLLTIGYMALLPYVSFAREVSPIMEYTIPLIMTMIISGFSSSGAFICYASQEIRKDQSILVSLLPPMMTSSIAWGALALINPTPIVVILLATLSLIFTGHKCLIASKAYSAKKSEQDEKGKTVNGDNPKPSSFNVTYQIMSKQFLSAAFCIFGTSVISAYYFTVTKLEGEVQVCICLLSAIIYILVNSSKHSIIHDKKAISGLAALSLVFPTHLNSSLSLLSKPFTYGPIAATIILGHFVAFRSSHLSSKHKEVDFGILNFLSVTGFAIGMMIKGIDIFLIDPLLIATYALSLGALIQLNPIVFGGGPVRKKTKGANGYDIPLIEDVELDPHESKVVESNIRVLANPEGHPIFLMNRSSNTNLGVSNPLGVGLIDGDFVNKQIRIGLHNRTTKKKLLKKGQFVVQLLTLEGTCQVHTGELIEDESERK